MLRREKARMLGLVFSNPLPRPHTPLDDGQEVALGPFRVRAIGMPGHTPGSTAYLVDGRYLFTGDALSLDKGIVCVSPWFMFMDPAMARRSLGPIASLEGVEIVATAHFGCSEDFVRAMQGWMT